MRCGHRRPSDIVHSFDRFIRRRKLTPAKETMPSFRGRAMRILERLFPGALPLRLAARS